MTLAEEMKTLSQGLEHFSRAHDRALFSQLFGGLLQLTLLLAVSTNRMLYIPPCGPEIWVGKAPLEGNVNQHGCTQPTASLQASPVPPAVSLLLTIQSGTPTPRTYRCSLFGPVVLCVFAFEVGLVVQV